MKSGRQAVGLGAMVVFSASLMAAGSALAFGQQWRPTAEFGPAQPYQGGAADRAFRPRDSVPVGYPRADRTQARSPRWQAYPPHVANPRSGGAFYPPPQFTQAAPAFGGWSQPMAYAGSFWPQQAPLFARQFGWQPGGNPWVPSMPSMMPQQSWYQYPGMPQTAGFRPTGHGYAPRHGGWRSMPPPGPSMPRHYAYQPAVYNGAHAAVPEPARVSDVSPLPVSAARSYWRPESRYPAPAWQAGSTFRPLAYGRDTFTGDRLAKRSAERQVFTRDNLPGWVTTYQETGTGDSCSWCGGS